MSVHFQPAGYNTAAPYLIVDGAGQTIEFLVKVFRGVERSRLMHADGRVRHAVVEIGDSVVMLADSIEGWPPVAAHVHVYVPDVDATYATAMAAGATSAQVPTKGNDADKRGGVKDPGGTTWWIATRTEG